jgi:NAD(P)-dependent dehydrogenase (short-subunit alcohol dehydrogenase family)
MRLKDKIAIITGGGRGIGKAIAEEFSKEGARVIVTAALKKDEIDSVASLTGGKAILSNISDKKDVAKLINNVTSEYGKIDILVNNAARGMKFVNESFMNLPKPFWEADPDMWRMVIDTNVNGVFLITQAVIP